MIPARQIIRRLFGYSGEDADGMYSLSWDERRQEYKRADQFYDNTLYSTEYDCNLRREIFRDLVGREINDRAELLPHFNPVAGIVDAYQHALRGSLGREIKLELDGDPLDSKLQTAIETIWKDSRFDDRKEAYQHYAANYGCAGLRVQATKNDAGQTSIRIIPTRPAEIIDIEETETGSLTSVLLEYQVLSGPLGEGREFTTYRELLTKETFERWQVRDRKRTLETLPNELGVCPFVLCRHRDKGRKPGQSSEYGMTAYHGSEDLIHLINIRMSQCGLALDKALWAKWFVSAGSANPEQFDFSGTTVIYSQAGNEDPQPTISALVEKIDSAGAMKQIELLMRTLIERQPEMVLDNLEALSGQSGETIAKLLVPVESRITTARQKYESPLIDAIRIGLSFGVMMSKWDLGTGSGTREAADRAYRSGVEDFTFNTRSALPQTAADIKAHAEAKFAEKKSGFDAARAGQNIVPSEEQIRVAGYSEEEAKKLAADVAAQQEESNARASGNANSR